MRKTSIEHFTNENLNIELNFGEFIYGNFRKFLCCEGFHKQY